MKHVYLSLIRPNDLRGLRPAMAAAILGAVAACAQTAVAPASAKLPAYDVATVRPNNTGSGNVSVNTRPTTLQAENVTIRDLLQEAFGVRRNVIFGLPGWADNSRFDINAKVTETDGAQLHKLTSEQRRQMLRGLFEDRFGLKWHYETRVMPALELVIAKDGPRLKEVPANGDNWGTTTHNSDMTATALPISAFTDFLSDQLERPVVDKTELNGRYDFHLKWTPDQVKTSADAGEDSAAPPPLSTALQEQLGLKLRPGKDPIRVVVVDNIARPSDN